MEYTVEHQEDKTKGAFFIRDGAERVAQMTYSRVNSSLVIVDHTEVDPTLGGRGVGRRLLDALVAWARTTNTKVTPLCPYAKAQFDKDPAIRDVLA